jgi:hypothetical protein
MHRPERQQAFLHARSAHERHDRVGQVDDLDALAGVDVDGFGDDRQVRRRWPRWSSETGVSRTVTTELLDITPL